MIAKQHITALGYDTALGICDHKTGRILFGCALEQVRLQPEAGLTGATTADDKNILISGGFGIGRPVIHGQALRLGEDDVVFKHRVNIGLDVLCCTP